MKQHLKQLGISALSATLLALSPLALAQLPITYVGGHAMYPSRNIIQNAVHSRSHTILVKAVEAAGLVHALEGKGPFTVFAPTNSAFRRLPAATLDHLLTPSGIPTLRKVLLYHVVAGRYDYQKLMRLAMEHGGRVRLKTLEGQNLWIIRNGDRNLEVRDAKGDVAEITTYDVFQSNGIIQVINRILMP